jgi:hypothetical protein
LSTVTPAQRFSLGKEAAMPVRSFALATAICAAIHAGSAVAQGPPAYSQVASGTVTPAMQSAGSYERLSGRNNPSFRYFGGSAAASAYAPQAARSLPAPRPVNITPNAKPFSGVQQASNITPYLGLDAGRETENSLPNYFLYVRPQIEQQRMNHVQQAQYRRLQQQVRTAGAPGVVSNPGGGIPTTGHSAQFMNNGGYYPTIQR